MQRTAARWRSVQAAQEVRVRMTWMLRRQRWHEGRRPTEESYLDLDMEDEGSEFKKETVNERSEEERERERERERESEQGKKKIGRERERERQEECKRVNMKKERPKAYDKRWWMLGTQRGHKSTLLWQNLNEIRQGRSHPRQSLGPFTKPVRIKQTNKYTDPKGAHQMPNHFFFQLFSLTSAVLCSFKIQSLDLCAQVFVKVMIA